jgi:hypothetical protein
MSDIGVEIFPQPYIPVHRPSRKPRTRAVIVAACRAFMQAGALQPPMQACCDRAGRSIRTGFEAFGTIEALRLEAADDPATRQAVVERVLGCERAALSAETLDRLVRVLVTGAA